MSTLMRGNAAEADVLQRFVAGGLVVLVPFGDGHPFDLAVCAPAGQISRVQVKRGWVRRGCVEFKTSSTDHGNGPGSYVGRADLIAVSVPELDQVFVIPVEKCPRLRGYLRLVSAANGQQRGVRMAADFEIERWITTHASVPGVASPVG